MGAATAPQAAWLLSSRYLASDARRGDRPALERDFFGAVGANAPPQLELLVTAWAEFAELRLAMRAEDILGVDRLAAARAGPKLARRAARLGQGLRLELQRTTFRHRERRPDDHVDEQAEDRQHQREPGGENVEQDTVRALPRIAECPVREAQPERQQVKDDDEEQRFQRR